MNMGWKFLSYFVIHLCNFIHDSFKPFKRSRLSSNPVEMSIGSPLCSLLANWCHTWRCITIRTVIWPTVFSVWILVKHRKSIAGCKSSLYNSIIYIDEISGNDIYHLIICCSCIIQKISKDAYERGSSYAKPHEKQDIVISVVLCWSSIWTINIQLWLSAAMQAFCLNIFTNCLNASLIQWSCSVFK